MFSKKGNVKYSKVVANIPEGLLDEFDKICEKRYYSRAEGIKEAMREFIKKPSTDNDISEVMDKIPLKEGIGGVVDLIAGLATDPRIQKLREEKRKAKK